MSPETAAIGVRCSGESARLTTERLRARGRLRVWTKWKRETTWTRVRSIMAIAANRGGGHIVDMYRAFLLSLSLLLLFWVLLS